MTGKPNNPPTTNSGPQPAAFTLVELMISIVIIAILVAIVAWAGGRSRQQSEIQKTQTVMLVLKDAITAYNDESGRWPPNPGQKVIDRVEPPILPADPRNDYFRDTFGTPSERVYSITGLVYNLMQETESKSVLRRLPGGCMFGINSPLFRQKNLAALLALTAVTVQGTNMPPNEAQVVVDAWDCPLWYGRISNINNGVPFLWSAGPNKTFEPELDPNDTSRYLLPMRPSSTSDDIVSYTGGR